MTVDLYFHYACNDNIVGDSKCLDTVKIRIAASVIRFLETLERILSFESLEAFDRRRNSRVSSTKIERKK